jgi:alpha-tubulin suppressor-like RCC1 family protein
MLVEGIEGMCVIGAAHDHSLAVTQSGAVFSWGCALIYEEDADPAPPIVEGFEGVCMRGVCNGER